MNKVVNIRVFPLHKADGEYCTVIRIRREDKLRYYIIENTSRAMTISIILQENFTLCNTKIEPLGSIHIDFEPKPEKSKTGYTILDSRHWYCHKNQEIVVVAVKGQANDWSAYIGGANKVTSPEEAEQETAANGLKLAPRAAQWIFLELPSWGTYRA